MKNLIAHRGLKKNSKENTLAAFKEALENNYYAGFECDVRTTKDNVFVICHNPIYKGKIISLTPYHDLEDIPSLEHVLNLKSSKIILLELKEINCNVEKLNDVLKRFSHQNIYVMSFYNGLIKTLKAKNAKIKVGVLNYVLNSEESYLHYDFICLLENIMTNGLYSYFTLQNKEIFIYNIHHLKEMTTKYKKSYFITDEVIE